ncbi:hypothetical protein Xbed_03491 [Xenorhabdus beddingii]|uniref:Uncharacterized protein n=1 Tax=Xenorhabdus beddingii TaxID=40578 RepID=A0A1Y2SEF7_9GAMM|nr:hypothetical protein Xbed_03491 [Xenorhabdus beddingii]
MLLVCPLQQVTTDQGALAKVKRGLCLQRHQFSNRVGVGFRRSLAQILIRQDKADVSRINVLARLTGNHDKAGTQDFLSGDQMVKCAGQGMAIELTGEAQCHWDMIGQTGSLIELTEEP